MTLKKEREYIEHCIIRKYYLQIERFYYTLLETENRYGCTSIHYAAINSGDILNELLNNANGILLLDEISNSPIYLDSSKFTFSIYILLLLFNRRYY